MFRKLTLVTVALMFYAYTAVTIAGTTAAAKPAQSAQKRVSEQNINNKPESKKMKKQHRLCGPANMPQWCD